MSELFDTLEAKQLDYLAYYASKGTRPLPEPSFKVLRNVAAQIRVTGGELSEEGRELVKRDEVAE